MKQETENKIQKLFRDAGASHVVIMKDNYDVNLYRVTVSRGGSDALGNLVSFKIMKDLSDLVGTEQINLQDEYHTEGCDTCDWGAESGVNFVCYNVKDESGQS